MSNRLQAERRRARKYGSLTQRPEVQRRQEEQEARAAPASSACRQEGGDRKGAGAWRKNNQRVICWGRGLAQDQGRIRWFHPIQALRPQKLNRCIGATTLDEYTKYIEKDPALERRFQPVKVPEPSVDATIEILKGLRERYEIYHKLRYTDESLVVAAHLSYRYISDRFLPDKALLEDEEVFGALLLEKVDIQEAVQKSTWEVHLKTYSELCFGPLFFMVKLVQKSKLCVDEDLASEIC